MTNTLQGNTEDTCRVGFAIRGEPGQGGAARVAGCREASGLRFGKKKHSEVERLPGESGAKCGEGRRAHSG